jgi:glutathione synthase
LRDGQVIAKANPMEVRYEAGNHFTFGDTQEVDLSSMDVVLMRQDPPFDMAYITATHILEHITDSTLVVNNPVSVRNAPEKLLVTHFEGLMPPTLITSDPDEIKAFRAEQKDIIIKPLYGNGGAGVFHLPPGDENLWSLVEMFKEKFREPMIVQKYVSAVREGDKRIILADGAAIGAINRVPAVGEARSNMHVGGRPEKSILTAREEEICEAIGPFLKDKGLIFVGIDVIGDYLTEINVTSPTGLQEINRFDGACLEAQIWDAIEAKLQ